MRLEGWNHIPAGYGAQLDVRAAALWLRCLFHIPIVDRFAYPLLVQRGHGFLRASPEWPQEQLGDVRRGWRIDPPDHEPPFSAWLIWRG